MARDMMVEMDGISFQVDQRLLFHAEGCLAGMGIYIFFAGLGTCTGETWAWTAGA